jgi:hypothetical protein
MSETSQSFRHEAEKIFTSTSEFHFPGMDQVLESAKSEWAGNSPIRCLF